jgi:tetratricopeptide (TPR) repeat protein
VRTSSGVRYWFLFFSTLLAAVPCAASSDLDEAVRLAAGNEFAKALTLFEKSLNADPDNVRAASEYRQTVIKSGDYDRCLAFFEKLAAAYPKSANVFLNFGFAYVDKIPDAGSITQVILADRALSNFTRAVELDASWINLYTRGNSYLFWPLIFAKAPLAVADLERMMKLQKAEAGKKSYHLRGYIAMGDAYCKTEQESRAKAIWKEGLRIFPESKALNRRLGLEGDDLKAYLDDELDPNKRVDTNLRELWVKP